MAKQRRYLDIWCSVVDDYPHEDIVSSFFGESKSLRIKKYDLEIGNGLLAYHHQLMHDVLQGRLRHPLSFTWEYVEKKLLRVPFTWEYAEKNLLLEEMVEDLSQVVSDQPFSRGTGRLMQHNLLLETQVYQMRVSKDLTFPSKYTRLSLGALWARTSDIADILLGPPPNAAQSDWEDLMDVKSRIRQLERDEDNSDDIGSLLDLHNTLVSKINLGEWKHQLFRRKPKDMLEEIDSLHRSFSDAQSKNECVDIVRKTYPLLLEIHDQLPYTREMLRSGFVLEQAYERLLALVRECLQKGEECLCAKYPEYYANVLGDIYRSEKYFQSLIPATPKQVDLLIQAMEETMKFYDFMLLHAPGEYDQRRAYWRCTRTQEDIVGCSLSALFEDF